MTAASTELISPEGAVTQAVECTDLSYQFATHRAVDHVNLSIVPGEMYGLLGPNGAGKTTTIRMITTLLKPATGAIRVFGLDAAVRPMLVRRVIGYVPQALSADANLTGVENVELFARLFDVPRRERRERVADALDAMGLTEAAGRLAGTYSGGMIRRLELAQSLISAPRLLVLDEPTVGLDPIARGVVWEYIAKLRTEHQMTVLMTTHYMDEADAYCDRISLMHRARIRVTGTPAELRASLGDGATLDDVFRHYTGDTLGQPKEEKEASVTYADPVAPPAVSADLYRGNPLAEFSRLLSRIGTLCWVELRKIRHDRTELYTRAIQPALWLLIYGEVFTRVHAIPTPAGIPYLAYLAPGIMAQSALFIAIFYGIQIIWERDAGVLTKLMVTPTPRSALITGKAFASGVRSLIQGIVVLIIAALLGVAFTTNPLKIIAALAILVLGSAFFSCLSMSLAGVVVARDRLMGIGQAITMPLFFSSSALYPQQIMPGWLQVISKINPLSYEVEGLRGLLIGTPTTLWLDTVVLVGAAMAAVTCAALLLPRLANR